MKIKKIKIVSIFRFNDKRILNVFYTCEKKGGGVVLKTSYCFRYADEESESYESYIIG